MKDHFLLHAFNNFKSYHNEALNKLKYHVNKPNIKLSQGIGKLKI